MLDELAEQLDDYNIKDLPLYGQESVRAQLEPFLEGDTPNILLLGPPGAGKTHMARWIASQKNCLYVESLCPVISAQAPDYGVWTLDECHRQSTPEPIFTAMGNPELTVIGTTTRPDKLDPAFRDRFFMRLHLEPLDMAARVQFLRAQLGDDTPDADLELLAKASAGNPRQVERISVAAKALKTSDPSTVLAAVRVTADGLDDLHMKILTSLAKATRPIGLSTLTLMTRADEMSVTEHEVLLLDLELVELSKAGRTLTDKGARYERLLSG